MGAAQIFLNRKQAREVWNEVEEFVLGCFFISTERRVNYLTLLTEPQGKIKK